MTQKQKEKLKFRRKKNEIGDNKLNFKLGIKVIEIRRIAPYLLMKN
jgi:hypothetical protein